MIYQLAILAAIVSALKLSVVNFENCLFKCNTNQRLNPQADVIVLFNTNTLKKGKVKNWAEKNKFTYIYEKSFMILAKQSLQSATVVKDFYRFNNDASDFTVCLKNNKEEIEKYLSNDSNFAKYDKLLITPFDFAIDGKYFGVYENFKIVRSQPIRFREKLIDIENYLLEWERYFKEESTNFVGLSAIAPYFYGKIKDDNDSYFLYQYFQILENIANHLKRIGLKKYTMEKIDKVDEVFKKILEVINKDGKELKTRNQKIHFLSSVINKQY